MQDSDSKTMVNPENLANEPAPVIFPSWAKYSFVILSLTKLWLVGRLTLFAIGYNVHDDRLFLTLANSLLSFKWLGHYNNLTLAKGMFYPLWIALTFLSGIPLLLSQHLLYIAACVVLIIAVRPLMPRPSMLLLCYAILLFNPMSYTDVVMTRVVREGIYPALTILVIACAIGLLVRHDRQLKNLAVWSRGLGFALSAFWLTREEGIWIIPSILVIVGFSALSIWRTKPIDWRRLFILCVLPFVIWAVILGTIAGINKLRYGVFNTVDTKSRSFLSAYGALLRVKHARWRPYIPVPKETRERIYEVSPAFSELRPFLEGDAGKNWAEHGCKALSICEEIAAGWFMWAFRDAVAAAGHYESGTSAANYYRRMATEINAACEDGKLDCFAKRSSVMPPWHAEYFEPLLNTSVRAAVFLARFDGFKASSSPSKGSGESLMFFRDLTRERLSPPNRLQIIGWAVTSQPASAINLSVRTSNGTLAESSMKIVSDTDRHQHVLAVGRGLPDARKSNFEIITPCAAGCFLHVSSGDRLLANLPLDGSMLSLKTPELQLHLDFLGFKKGNLLKLQATEDHLKIKTLNQIGIGYQTVIPILISLTLIAYVSIGIVNIFKKRIVTRLWIINTSLLIAIVARLFIFSMIHVTSFPGINTQYLSSAYPLLLLFIVFVLVDSTNLDFIGNRKKGIK